MTKLQATCLFTQVDRIDPWIGTPSLATLNGYDAVIVYSGSGFPNNVAIGDVLADYVDGGGRVVVGALAFWTSDHALGMGGRLSTGGYLPFTQGPQAAGIITCWPTVPSRRTWPTSAPSTAASAFQNVVSLASGATLIAHWNSGAPLVAVKSHVVGLNFYPPSSDAAGHFWNASTDGDILMANALLGGGVVTGPAGPRRDGRRRPRDAVEVDLPRRPHDLRLHPHEPGMSGIPSRHSEGPTTASWCSTSRAGPT